MRKLIVVMIGLVLLVLSGCASVMTPKLGITRDQWLHRTLVGDRVYAEGNMEIWRSGGRFYYFKDGILIKVDEGQERQKRLQIEIINK